MKKLKEFVPLWNFIKEEKLSVIVASIMIFASEIVLSFVGYFCGEGVEAITDTNIKLALIYFVLYFLSDVIGDTLYQYSSSVLQKIESKVTRKLEYDTYKKSLNLPAYAYEKMSSGEVINRVTNDSSTLSFAFLNMLELLASFVGSLIILIYIFMNSWIVGVEIIICVTVLLFIIKKYNVKLIKIHKERKKIHDKFTSLTNETIRGIREVKTLGIKKSLSKNILDINNEVLNKSFEEIDTRKQFKYSTVIIKDILASSVFISIIILLYYQEVELAFLISMTYYVYRYTWLVDNLNSFSEVYQRTYVSLQRVNELLENRLYEDDKFGTEKINNIKGIIEFNDVVFGYPNESTLLNNFSLKIEPNKKIAIIGKSGQGKSTLFNLLTRIFDPISGSVSVDGVNIEKLSEDYIRSQISIIRQEPFIFNRSIIDNFKLINPNISIKEIRKYTKMSYLDDYIMSLPDGYDTILGEGGVNLSGGQKQRLSIARTLAKKSKIILFDEATSALDNESQNYIKKSIDNLIKDHTVILVAHRLSTIVDADIIHVVDKGRVVASGSHDELINNCNIYKNLYTSESLNSIK